MTTPLRDEDVERSARAMLDAIALQLGETPITDEEWADPEDPTGPGDVRALAVAALTPHADRLLPPVVSERVDWQSRRSDEPWVSCDFPHPDGCTWPQHRFRRVVSYTDGSERIYRWEEAE